MGMSAAQLAIVISARDAASPALRTLAGNLNGVKSTVASVQSALSTGIGVAVGLVGFQSLTATLNAAKDAAIGFNSKMQQGAIGWGATLKDEALGVAVTMDNLKTSIRTGLDFAQMNKNTRYLVNMGVAAKDVKDTYLDIANVAAGTGLGKEAIDRITWALGQMQAKGVVSAEEMTQQLGELIPAWQILADHIGKTVAETQKMAQNKEISPNTMLEAFRAFSKENFGDMLAKQARTWQGAMNIIGSAGQYITGISFKPIFDELSALAVKVADFARSDDFAAIAAGMQGIVGEGLSKAKANISGVIDAIRNMGSAWAEMSTNTRNQILAVALELGAGGALIKGIQFSIFAWGRAAQAVTLFSAIAKTKLGMVGLAAGAMVATIEFGSGALRGTAAAARGAAEGIDRALGGMMGNPAFANNPMFTGMKDLTHSLITGFADVEDALAVPFEEGRDRMNAAIAAAAKAAGDSTGDMVGQFAGLADFQSAWTKAQADSAAAMADAQNQLAQLPPAANTAANAIGEIGKEGKSAADLLGVSTSQMVSYLVSIDPAAQAAAAAVGAIQLRIVGLQDQQEGLQDAMKGAQAVLQGLQDQASRLSEALSNAKSRLEDLANVKLTGMGDMDKQMFQIEQAIKRIKLAQLGQDVSGLQPLTAEARAFAATLPASVGELEKMLEILRLQKSLRYDEQLKAIQEAAKGAGRELSFDEAMKQIGQTKDEIGSLNNQISANKAAIDAQQATIRGLQDAMDGVSKAMAQAQRDLQGAEKHQTAVNDVLKTYYEWLIEVRPELIKAGDEHILQALRIDEATRNMVDTMKQYVKDQTNEATKMINAALDAYNNAKTQMAMGLLPGGAPNNTSGEPAGTTYGEEGAIGQNSGVNGYGGSYGSFRGGNGTRGAAPAAPNVYITVQGTVISERDLVTSVRNELIKAGKRNVNVGLS